MTEVHGFVDEGLGHSSYVIDLGDGTAAIVDPPRFPIAHEALIDRSGWQLVGTIDTHSHADYITGSPGLAARRSATFIAPAASQLATAHRGVTDGEQLQLAPTVAAHLAAGAVLVDARPFRVFGGGHIAGSLSNTLQAVFGSWLGWLGWLVPADTPVVFLLDPAPDRAAATGVTARVFDGRPDTWSTATGRALAVGR